MPAHPTLQLAPSSARGWFGGRALAAGGPLTVREGLSVSEAGEILEATFEGGGPPLTVALVTYEGAATVATYAGALEPPPAVDAGAVYAATPLVDHPRMSSGVAYRAGVETVRERIAAGDVYVLNLTHAVEGDATLEPREAFAALLGRAGSDMSAYFETPRVTLASVSPERFARVRRVPGGRVVEIQPIKGTRPRGATPKDDAASAAELVADPKERAEHVMVVDLERNDLGRVCQPGSVVVDPLYEVVPTPYCHQLVSTVKGLMRPDASIADLLEATFPCGSVTGAPKLAAISIAAGLEGIPRGPYCGSLLVALPGEIDSSVLIRTLETRGERVRWGTGCGITHQSDAAAEWLESLLKASPALGDRLPEVALRETGRVVDGRLPLLDRHLARLAEGGCGPGVLARVRAEVAGALARWRAGGSADGRAGRLGVTVTPDGSVVADVTGRPSSLEVDGGPRVAVVEVDGLPELPRRAAKPAARRYWDLAHRAARARGAEQAAIAAPDGALVDGSTASVWLRFGDRLVTPPSPPAVAGVVRGLVFDVAASLGFTAEEGRLARGDLDSADEVFLTNAYGGVVPVRDRGGAAAEALADVLRERYGW